VLILGHNKCETMQTFIVVFSKRNRNVSTVQPA
jgi:hypothetical protein